MNLKEFITNVRSCDNHEEMKELILRERAAIKDSFSKKKQKKSYIPRNLVKLLFINLQGYETNFGEMESLSLACQNSFLQKKIGYLTFSVFAHQNSDMLMMAINRLNLDLQHSNL